MPPSTLPPTDVSKFTRVAIALIVLLLPAHTRAATPRDTLVMAWNLDALITFDPGQTAETNGVDILRNVCDSLVAFDRKDETKIVPATAERWSLSSDGRTLTFTLRTNLRFPSGKRATAYDAAWSMQRVVRLGFGASAYLTGFGFTKEGIAAQIRAADERTLLVTMDRAYPVDLVLSAVFTNWTTAILDREEGMQHAKTVDGRSDEGNAFFRTSPTCVGSYRLTRWNADDVVILERNDSYYGEKPKLKRVIIRHVPESGAQRLLLEQGDIDVARSLSAADLRALVRNRDIVIQETIRQAINFLAFNMSDPILRQPKVRLAFRYLIDYDGLGRTVLEYQGIPRASPVPLGAFGALDKKAGQPFKLDLVRAKALITEAGYPNGFSKKLTLSANGPSPLIAQHVQANAAKIGITLELEQLADANLTTRSRARDFQVTLISNGSVYPDAHATISRHAANPDNRAEAKLVQYFSWRTSWQEPKINAMADQAMMERNPSKRIAMYAALQTYMLENGPMAYIYQTVRTIAVRREVQGVVSMSSQVFYGTASK